MNNSPLISIGMPVFNGERFLREAIESLLAQDYSNFEIIISDNDSSDGTEAICRAYEARDPRVTYRRAERNMGAVWNFNRVFALSRGEYFMWAAADDTREASYVRTCLDSLMRNPEAVLCYSRTCVVTPGHPVMDVLEDIDLTQPDQRDRFVAMMKSSWWKWGLAFYGLMRSAALRRTRLCENVYGHDYDVVLQLCLQGPFVRCGVTSFYYTKNLTGEDDATYYRRVMKSLDPVNRPGALWLPYWKMALRFLGHAASAPGQARNRVRLACIVLQHGLLTRQRAMEARQLIGTMTGLRRVRDSFRSLTQPSGARS